LNADSTRQAPRESRPPLLLLFAITVTGITQNTLVTPIVPEILAAFDAPVSLAGPLVAAASAPGIAIAPLIGVLADRYGRRTVLVPCLVLFGVAGGLCTLAPSIWVLIGLRLLYGIGGAGLINLVVVIIGDHWSGTDRARIIGWNSAVLTVSIAVLPPIGGLLTDLADWRAPFALYPLALITAVLAYRTLEPGPRLDITVREQLAGVRPFLREPIVKRSLGGGVIIFVLIFGLLLTVLPVYAELRFGLGATARGVLLGLPAVTSTIAALLIGRLTGRFGRRPLLVAGCGLFAVSLAAVAVAPTVALLVTAVLTFGVGEGLLIPTLQDIAAGIAPSSSRGAVVAIWVGGARFGQTIGPLLAASGHGAIGAEATFVAGAAVSLLLVFLFTGQEAWPEHQGT
jgi:MFS transporter, ACDE family, multidrug resistance protein